MWQVGPSAASREYLWEGMPMTTQKRAPPLYSRHRAVMQHELRHLVDQRHSNMLWPALQG